MNCVLFFQISSSEAEQVDRLITFPKTNFDISKSHYVTVFDLAGFTVRDSATINVGAICGSCVGDQQRALLIHKQGSVNFGYADVIHS